MGVFVGGYSLHVSIASEHSSGLALLGRDQAYPLVLALVAWAVRLEDCEHGLRLLLVCFLVYLKRFRLVRGYRGFE